jgi:hypothetical protein
MVLSELIGTDPLFLDYEYFSNGAIIPLILLTTSLIFCSFRGIIKIKTVLIIIISSLIVQLIISYSVKAIRDVWINPMIFLFILSIIAAIIPIIRNIRKPSKLGNFFKKNGRHIIHLGISFIFGGAILGEGILQTICFFSGFIICISGILPLIVISIIKSQKSAVD